jgi:nitroimidazol reductase NimA-like FMN-containing flavoprotein (pyridoxamine 5'-phosphate oxidase superfamily)
MHIEYKHKFFIDNLLAAQLFGVLNTWNKQGPHSSLVAFFSSDDISAIYFAAIRSTQKYRNILENPNVSFLVDNRLNTQNDLRKATSIICYGTAGEITGNERTEISAAYLEKYPSLHNFIGDPECAVVKIKIAKYVISGFKDVFEYRIDY